MARRHGVIAVAGLLVLLALTLTLRTQEKVSGVFVTELVARCQLTHFTLRSQQPVRTFTLDCPGVDSIRLWPWPVMTNWCEDNCEWDTFSERA